MVTTFCAGAAAALISVESFNAGVASKEWHRIAWLFTALLIALSSLQRKSLLDSAWGRAVHLEQWAAGWIPALVCGLAMGSWFVYWRSRSEAKATLAQRLFSAAPARALGQCSYSLYLIHAPLLGVLWLLTRSEMHPLASVALHLLIWIPFTVSIAWLFYLAFERPALAQMSKLR
jgi:peptidoglycan/LPS O-acetylase OafA/YrhL